MIYQLKRARINQNELVRIYVSVIRPVVEYACPVCTRTCLIHIGQYQIIQNQCLKTIFPGFTYEDILQMAQTE